MEETTTDVEGEGTRWAVLIAGSNGYWNYRHQVIPPASDLSTIAINLFVSPSMFFVWLLLLLNRINV